MDDLDETVHLRAWDASWPVQARAQMTILSLALGNSIVAIEHVGSTAVEGLPAKPILDLMIGYASVVEPDMLAIQLVQAGWRDLGEAGVPGRRYLRQRRAPPMNLHLVEHNGSHWCSNLALRDYLSAHPEAARAYGAIKQRAVDEGHRSLLDYSRYKTAIVLRLLGEARHWAGIGRSDSRQVDG